MFSVPLNKDGAVGLHDQKEEEAITKFFEDAVDALRNAPVTSTENWSG